MSESVSYKVWLQDPTGKQKPAVDSAKEVRRFTIDKEVSTNLLVLQDKLVTLFPRLMKEHFDISWTDQDGDVITIGTNEELIIALTEMKGPVYKINVTVKEGKTKIQSDRDGSKPRWDYFSTLITPIVFEH